MEWERIAEWLTSGWLIGLATLVPAVIGVVTFLASVPFSPARFYAWQLRRQGATVAALDPERHANQREVLQRRIDYLASKAAAAQHIPTPWRRYVIGAVIWSYFAWMIFLLAWQGPAGPPGSPPSFIPPGALGWLFAVWFQILVAWAGLRSTLVYAVNNYRERARFIAEGCPPNFEPRPHLHARIRATEEAEIEEVIRADPAAVRALRMGKRGEMPNHWRTRSLWVLGFRRGMWLSKRISCGIQREPMPRRAAHGRRSATTRAVGASGK